MCTKEITVKKDLTMKSPPASLVEGEGWKLVKNVREKKGTVVVKSHENQGLEKSDQETENRE